MKVQVNTLWDISIGFSIHGWYQIPPVPPPPGMAEIALPKVPSMEIPIPQGWPVGIGAGTVQKTSTVIHKGTPIILDGHDCGPLIPQLTFPPVNLLFPIELLSSKRKTVFSAFTVRMNGKPTAVASLIFFPMLSCGSPVSMPLTFPVTNLGNTVTVGVTLADIVGGFLTIAFTLGTDYLFSRVKFFNPTNPGENALESQLQQYAQQKLRSAIAKSAISALTGFTTSAVQHSIDSRYPFKLNVSFSPPNTKVTIGVTSQFGSSDRSNNPSSVGVNVGYRNTGTRGTASLNGSATYTFDAGSNHNAEGVTVSESASGSRTSGVSGSASHSDTFRTNSAHTGAGHTSSTSGGVSGGGAQAGGTHNTGTGSTGHGTTNTGSANSGPFGAIL